jgi:carbonic anhydrase
MPLSIHELIQGNSGWVDSMNEKYPGFFDQLDKGQSPKFLWIGCSDSRVPATEITAALPGSIFVQRNIANIVSHADANLLSVVYYAVKYLKVRHIVICGHYGCGGVGAAMSNEKYGFLDNWLVHIKDVYRLHKEELDSIKDDKERTNRLVELNVMEQVNNLAMVSFLQEEWENGEYPYIHGWVYSLKDGRIKDLGVSVNSAVNLLKVYQYSPEKHA